LPSLESSGGVSMVMFVKAFSSAQPSYNRKLWMNS
jgi:hypothetical protein